MTVNVGSFEEALELAKAGQSSMCPCPGHDDSNPSLSVGPGDDQPVVLHCFADCDTNQILAEAGVSLEALLSPVKRRNEPPRVIPSPSPAKSWKGAQKPVCEYVYTDEAGAELYRKRRYVVDGKKTFDQGVLNERGFLASMKEARRVLYNLPTVIDAARRGDKVVLVEGEKDAETLIAAGRVATTWGGANDWRPEFCAYLVGAEVHLIADADEPGRKVARQIRQDLIDSGIVVTVYETPQPHKDVTELLDAGGTLSQLLETIPFAEPRRELSAVDFLDIMEEEDKEESWLIPGVMARGERLLLVGLEGNGKSEMIRQLAVQVAAGVNPFSMLEPTMEPQRVLLLDMENHERQSRGSFKNLHRILRAQNGQIDRGMLKVYRAWDEEVDLMTPAGEAWLTERVNAHKPQLLLMGPLSNMVGGDMVSQESVTHIKRVVNKIRSLYDTAVVMEHHAPLRRQGDKQREVRPYGHSTFYRWPDFGRGMTPTSLNDWRTECWYRFNEFRKDRVRGRKWPDYWRVGKTGTLDWPWMPGTQAEYEDLGGKPQEES